MNFKNFISDKIKRILIINHLKSLKNKYNNSPVPLNKILQVKSLYGLIIHDQDPILPPFDTFISKGSSLQISELKDILYDETLGQWSLEKNTIEFIWHKLLEENPKVIIECGAGISTIIFARYASIYSSQSQTITIISIEQDEEVKKSLEDKLLKLGLSDHVIIIYAPIVNSGEYEIKSDLSEIFTKIGSKSDWLMIDGPSGPEGCRIWTLPQLAKFCKPNARWLLDDALRDGELELLVKWSELPGVVVEGVHPIGKGLASGKLKDPGAVNLHEH